MKLLHLFFLTMMASSLWAGPIKDALAHEDEKQATIDSAIRQTTNVSYGKHPREKYDVYQPALTQKNAPIIFMVHGGAWMIGDKAHQSVVENKVNYWVAQRGYILVSINYPMLPGTPVSEQLTSVAKALGVVQEKASSLGGDKQKVILMGHSAGAHLVALLSASNALYPRYTITTPLATILLDSAVYNTPALMSAPHMHLYDRAFGTDPLYWQKLSPYHQLSTKRSPILAVCSTQRENACEQSRQFLDKASSFGTKTELVQEPMSHKDINLLLGKDLTYTKAVDDFLRSVKE